MEHFVKAIAATLIVIGGVLVAMCLGPLFGALAGWVVGITPIGGWVSTGAQALGLKVAPGDLWAIGAFIGFVAPSFRAASTSKAD